MDQNLPITKIGIVEDKNKCPPDYDILLYSADRNDECDLMPDGFFKKTTRYLCISRKPPSIPGQVDQVLADIAIQNEKERPPNGYCVLEHTLDTKDKATKKKQICVKLIERESTTAAITDINLYTKTKRAPMGFTLAGEINNVALCFKIGDVPRLKSNPVPSPTLPATSKSKSEAAKRSTPSSIMGNQKFSDLNHFQSNSSSGVFHPLSGVPFVLNSAFSSSLGLQNVYPPDVQSRTGVDIANEYQYPFTTERSILQI